MNKLVAAALGLILVGALTVQAAPHHRHRVCVWHHHHRICRWR